MKNNKKIRIHVKNNHWAPGSFPTDAEGEKNFTITKEHLDQALKDFPEIKEKVEIFVDWDEDNFKSSISNSDILFEGNGPDYFYKEHLINHKNEKLFCYYFTVSFYFKYSLSNFF